MKRWSTVVLGSSLTNGDKHLFDEVLRHLQDSALTRIVHALVLAIYEERILRELFPVSRWLILLLIAECWILQRHLRSQLICIDHSAISAKQKFFPFVSNDIAELLNQFIHSSYSVWIPWLFNSVKISGRGACWNCKAQQLLRGWFWKSFSVTKPFPNILELPKSQIVIE